MRVHGFQREIVLGIYDNPSGTRQAIITMPRKNGKTTFIACLLLAHIAGPVANPGSEVYSAAQGQDQAAIVFRRMEAMIELSPVLRSRMKISRHQKIIEYRAPGILYKALSSKGSTNIGSSPAVVVHDELGQVENPTYALYDALETGMMAHENPLSIIISTEAGSDDALLSQLIDQAEEVKGGRVRLFRYTCNSDLSRSKPFSEDALRSANPAWEIPEIISQKELLYQAEVASKRPTQEGEYRNKHLNQRISASQETWLTQSEWMPVVDEGLDLERFQGCDCWAAVDLSLSRDMTCLVLIFNEEGEWQAFPFFWLPEGAVTVLEREDKLPYRVWSREGHLQLEPSETLKYDDLAQVILQATARFKVSSIAVDQRFRYAKFQEALEHAGGGDLPLVPHPQGFSRGSKDYGEWWMPASVEETTRIVLDRSLKVASNPILNLHVASAVPRHSLYAPKDRFLMKRSSRARIDGAVTLCMAVGATKMTPKWTLRRYYNSIGAEGMKSFM